MTIVLGGDFRQILHVVRKGTRQDIVNASINSSKIWVYCNVLRLTVNMRLGASSIPVEQEEIANFGKWILSIRDGNDASDENGRNFRIFAHIRHKKSFDVIYRLCISRFDQ